MLIATELPRVFLFKNGTEEMSLADPDPEWTPERVQDFYTGNFPVLTAAKIEGPEIVDDKVTYKFSPVIGTKG